MRSNKKCLYCKEKVNKESYQENITITLNKQSKQISELVNMISTNSINEGNQTNYSVSNNNNIIGLAVFFYRLGGGTSVNL